ncbi:MAG: ParB/RepB/Spo0J family partition protein [Rhodospirillales bacterium]|nr:ParB/RepB/Spo0J family partition protein [Rhodospirillales bacterium]
MAETTPQRSSLGRGLAALFGEEGEDYAALDKVRAAKDVPVEHLHPNPKQPRQSFDEDKVGELAASIRENGILQPILVRRHPKRPSEFEIVAGERRWRAAQLAKLHEVPVVIRELSDAQVLEMALVENVQREDLNAIEEAEAYQRLVDEFRHTQEDLARAVGKSRSHVANTLRLLGLPSAVKALLTEGLLSAGHGRALLTAEDPEGLAREVVAKGLNVRQTESLAKSGKSETAKASGGKATAAKDPDTLALERDLSARLGLRVTIDFKNGGGCLSIHYKTLEQLDGLLRRLDHPAQES